jgi:hypothetical protein
MDHFQLQPQDLAGFELAGIRQPDGRVTLMGRERRTIEGWPESITLLEVTYKLENVVQGRTYPDGSVWENAIYV